jgi:hypothetical protein
MDRSDVDLLRDVRITPAVSILAPTHLHDPENNVDPLTVKNLVKSATERLLQQMTKREAMSTIDNITAAVRRIDWEHTGLGVAIFASPKHSTLLHLPIAPPPTATVDGRFAIRELVRCLNRSWRYRVLVLSEKPTRLFVGSRNRVVEERDGFPIFHEGPGGAINTPGGYGINSSAERDLRHREFFRRVANELSRHVERDPLPLFVMGVDRFTSFWTECAPEYPSAGVVHGSFDFLTPDEIAKLLWPTVERHFDDVRHRTLQRLDGARDQKRFVGGFDEVYRAARDRRVELLVAPEDLTVTARLGSVHVEILDSVDDSVGPVEGDLVDVIVREVLGQRGEVVFLERELLDPYGSIGAVTRY